MQTIPDVFSPRGDGSTKSNTATRLSNAAAIKQNIYHNFMQHVLIYCRGGHSKEYAYILMVKIKLPVFVLSNTRNIAILFTQRVTEDGGSQLNNLESYQLQILIKIWKRFGVTFLRHLKQQFILIHIY